MVTKIRMSDKTFLPVKPLRTMVACKRIYNMNKRVLVWLAH